MYKYQYFYYFTHHHIIIIIIWLKILLENSKKSCSYTVHKLQGKNLAEMPICEEAEVSPDEFMSPIHHEGRGKYDIIDVSQKRGKISKIFLGTIKPLNWVRMFLHCIFYCSISFKRHGRGRNADSTFLSGN